MPACFGWQRIPIRQLRKAWVVMPSNPQPLDHRIAALPNGTGGWAANARVAKQDQARVSFRMASLKQTETIFVDYDNRSPGALGKKL